MHHSLGETGTYVSSYPLANMIRFHFKRSDQIVLSSNLSSTQKTPQIQ